MGPVDPNSVGAFLPILIMVVVATGFAAFTLAASHFLGKRVNDPAKLAPYECGVTPVGNARERFHTRFYLVAMLFIVFDIETVFLYPYAMSFVATGLVWQWTLNPQLGLQATMRGLGWDDFSFDWIVNQDKVVYTLVMAAVWQASGLVMAVLLAGLRGIDEVPFLASSA